MKVFVGVVLGLVVLAASAVGHAQVSPVGPCPRITAIGMVGALRTGLMETGAHVEVASLTCNLVKDAGATSYGVILRVSGPFQIDNTVAKSALQRIYLDKVSDVLLLPDEPPGWMVTGSLDDGSMVVLAWDVKDGGTPTLTLMELPTH